MVTLTSVYATLVLWTTFTSNVTLSKTESTHLLALYKLPLGCYICCFECRALSNYVITAAAKTSYRSGHSFFLNVHDTSTVTRRQSTFGAICNSWHQAHNSGQFTQPCTEVFYCAQSNCFFAVVYVPFVQVIKG